ncbi:MAG: phage protease [Alphaproteobacteria bacterium]
MLTPAPDPTFPAPALMAALPLPDGSGEVPEWIHLVPAGTGGVVATVDGRGPYRIADMVALVRASLEPGGKLPVDENHAIDLAAPAGLASPARGWIVALEARPDGIWGRVEWTPAGRELMAGRAYRGISPALRVGPDGTVLQILRASLVNVPNLRGLAALHFPAPRQETRMTLLQRLAQLLGEEAAASEDAAVAAVTALSETRAAATALQAQLAEIGRALGVPAAGPAAIIEAARALQSARAENDELATRLQAVETAQRRGAAEAWLAGLIAAKRAIPADRREGLVTLHMQDPAQAETIATLYPVLDATRTGGAPPAPPAGTGALDAVQLNAARLLGVKPEDYAATLEAERAQKENV